MSTAKFDQWLNPNGTENYKTRAWVNFNGTGTVAIRASGNVASITDNGTGDYTVNFATAMPDANYCALGTVRGLSDADKSRGGNTLDFSPTTLFSISLIRVRTLVGASTQSNGNTNDNPEICVSIFR